MNEIAVSSQYAGLSFSEDAVVTAVRACISAGLTAIAEGELSIVFVADYEIADIHAKFMDDPTPTDVITFDADPEMESAGEICVSVDTAARECSNNGCSFSEEMTLYVVHGLLHLAGYDDRSPEDLAQMRAAERKAMDHLKNTGHLPQFTIA